MELIFELVLEELNWSLLDREDWEDRPKENEAYSWDGTKLGAPGGEIQSTLGGWKCHAKQFRLHSLDNEDFHGGSLRWGIACLDLM